MASNEYLAEHGVNHGGLRHAEEIHRAAVGGGAGNAVPSHQEAQRFGAESSTLDIAAPNWDPSVLEVAERVANELASENREIVVTFEDAASAQGLRKASDREGTLRRIPQLRRYGSRE